MTPGNHRCKCTNKYTSKCRGCCHKRASYSIAPSARESGDRGARCTLLTAPVGAVRSASRGDHSLYVLRQPLRSFYIAERARLPRAFGCHCSCSLALALRLCFVTLLVSAGALLSSLVCFSSFFCCSLQSALLSSLHCSRLCCRLCSASVSSVPRLRLSLVVCDF